MCQLALMELKGYYSQTLVNIVYRFSKILKGSKMMLDTMCVKCRSEYNEFKKIWYIDLIRIKLLPLEYYKADILSSSPLSELSADAHTARSCYGHLSE